RRAYHRRLPGEPRLRHERGEEHDHGSQASHIASDETEIGYPGAPAVPDSSGGPSVSRATASSGSRAYMGPTRTKRAPRNYFRSARFHWWAVKDSNLGPAENRGRPAAVSRPPAPSDRAGAAPPRWVRFAKTMSTGI